MACSPQDLIESVRCTDTCVPTGAMVSIEIALACQWVNAGPCTLPTAPVDLGATAGDSQVTLTWPAGTGATGYNIKRSLVAGGPYTVIGTSATSPYIDHTAVNGTTYYYVVSSTNACGESTGNSIESNATPVAVLVPVNVTVPVITGTAEVGYTLSGSNGTWTNSPTGYTYRWLANGTAIGGATANTFTLTSAQIGEVITFEVTASNAGGNSAPATSTATSAVLPVAPSKAITPSPANGATGVVPYAPMLSWINGGGATSYDVWFNGAFIGNQAGTTYSPGALAFNTAYTWRIDAVNAGGTTTGDTWGFTTVAEFSYAPSTDSITWTDKNGSGMTASDLASFLASADFDSVASIQISNQTLVSISNLASLPSLQQFIVADNPAFDGPVDLSGNPLLYYVWVSGSLLTSIDLSHNPLLTSIFLYNNKLTVLAVNTILAQLVTFGLTGGNCFLNGQTPAAAPSIGPPNGIVAKAALLAEVPAWTVPTD